MIGEPVFRPNESDSAPARGQGALSALRRIARAKTAPQWQEHCELCSLALPSRHRHLLEMPKFQIVCACDACALTFDGAVNSQFKAIPRTARALNGFQLSDEAWARLALPVHLVFVFQNSHEGRPAAMYPSPAGATQSPIDVETWDALTEEHPVLRQMAPDIEALLINRTGPARDSLIVPIDRCFALAGIIRTHWRGFSGGGHVWKEIEQLLTELRVEAGLMPSRQEVARA